MPDRDYVIHLGNNCVTTYRYRMHQEDLAKQFGRWYRLSHQDQKTICLLGIRANESLQRYSGFINIQSGSADSLKKYGALPRCMTGQSMMYGTPTPCFSMIITSFMIYTIRPDLRYPRCGWLLLLMTIRKILLISIG